MPDDLDHPPSVYLREDQLTGPLDTWLADAFHPDRIEQCLTELEQAQPDNTPALDAAHHTLAELDQKLAKYRAALEAGADPVLVAEWIKEVRAEREYVTNQIAALEPQKATHRKMTQKEIEQLTTSIGGLPAVLRKAYPTDNLEVYRQLGLKLTFDHTTRTVVAEANPQPPVGVVVVSGGGLEPPRPIPGTSTSS